MGGVRERERKKEMESELSEGDGKTGTWSSSASFHSNLIRSKRAPDDQELICESSKKGKER